MSGPADDHPVYLDYAATAPLRPEAREAMLRVLDGAWGNPSSVHARGRQAKAILEDARARLAALIGAEPREIVFTRGGTEADNLAILGRHAVSGPGEPLLVSATEHRAVLESAEAARGMGREVERLPVDSTGRLRMDAVRSALERGAVLVSVMWVNNETGAVQPLPELASVCADRGVSLHSDAIQAFGKISLRMDDVPVGLLSLSAHKVGGPKGVGALFVRRGTALLPLIHGGGQEGGMRPGTEDVAGAAAFAAAAEAAERDRPTEMPRLAALRDRLETGLRDRIPGLIVNSAESERIATISNLSIPGADPELLLAALDLEGIAASSGSACSSGSVRPSHVLLAMGLSADEAAPSIRFSLGPGTTDAHIDRVIGVLPPIAGRLRSL